MGKRPATGKEGPLTANLVEVNKAAVSHTVGNHNEFGVLATVVGVSRIRAGSLESCAMPAFDRDEVARLAALARIDLTDAELDQFAGELSVIVDAVAMVSANVDPEVPATSHPFVVYNVFRDDVAGDLLDRDELLEAAPEAEDGMFVVPQILGEE